MSEVTEYIQPYGIDSTNEYPFTVTDGNNIEIRDSYISTTGEINEQNILIEFLDKTNNKTKMIVKWKF